jgi:hypothetical protein
MSNNPMKNEEPAIGDTIQKTYYAPFYKIGNDWDIDGLFNNQEDAQTYIDGLSSIDEYDIREIFLPIRFNG